jgi:hypothetical protein
LTFVASVLYFTIAGATKLGILCMYYRIFRVNLAFRYQLFLSAALVVGWWVGCTVATLTNCIPLKWSWINGLVDPRYCFNYNVFWMAAGVCEIFLDVVILTLPINVLMRLRLSRKRKFTVSGVFLLGGLYVTAQIMLSHSLLLLPLTTVSSVVITGVVKVVLGYPPNSRVPSYSNTEVWATVHTGIAIVCSSLPVLQPFVDRVTKSSIITRASDSLLTLGAKIGLRPYSVLQKDSGGGSANSWNGSRGIRSELSPGPGKKIASRTDLLEIAHAEDDIELAGDSGAKYMQTEV